MACESGSAAKEGTYLMEWGSRARSARGHWHVQDCEADRVDVWAKGHGKDAFYVLASGLEKVVQVLHLLICQMGVRRVPFLARVRLT